MVWANMDKILKEQAFQVSGTVAEERIVRQAGCSVSARSLSGPLTRSVSPGSMFTR
jgi:hypothetical protein